MDKKPCSDDAPDFRYEQCAAFDKIPYEGVLYQWQPFYDDDQPCALTCKGRLKGSQQEDLLIVVTLKEKAHDGTRCRPGSLDMCIAGFCECDAKYIFFGSSDPDQMRILLTS